MNLIVAVDEKWGIGKNNDLLYSIPEDMRFFRATTMSKVVVMGRKTLLSFPNQKPLKNRINIVLSTNKEFKCEGAFVVHSKEELFEELKKYNSDDVFIIGGASIYNEYLEYCNKLYITKMFNDFGAEIFIKNVDNLNDFVLIERSEIKEYEGVKFQFCTYVKKEN